MGFFVLLVLQIHIFSDIRSENFLYVDFVAKATCFHFIRVDLPTAVTLSERSESAVEFYKSAFTLFGFFGTLCTRPATKSKISARASNGYKLYLT